MKKLILIFSGLLTGHFADAQKIICITDSTTIKQYFGGTPEIVFTTRGNRTVGVTSQQAPSAPAPENDGIPGGPLIRITKNDNAATLRKELGAVTRSMDWPSVMTSAGRLQYRAFVGSEGKIDSLAYYIVHTDTSRQNRNFMMRDKIGRIGLEGFRINLENQWMKVIQNYTGVASKSPARTYTGFIGIGGKVKNLDEFLNSLADTVTTINLTDYGLREFPYQLRRFRNLKNINLKDNYIGSAMLDKKDFPKLVTISFQNNLLRDDSLKFTGGLRPPAINLTDNHYTRIPKTHRRVKYLYLANSSISEVTKKDIRKIRKVEFLNLYANTVTEITPKIARLKKLKELDLYRNRLSSLPPAITRMKKLETLAVSHNTLEELPPGIRSMSSLKTLYSHHNKLKALPPLPESLEVLDVGYNRIEEVSARVQPLKKLKTLDYSYNQVKGDLDFLLALPQIKEIYFMENHYASSEEEEKYFSKVFSTLVSRGVTVK